MKSKSYDDFIEKFKPKKTTDDCYTPTVIYDEVLAWCRNTYGLGDDVLIVRPFYPGGCYRSYNYPPDSVVIDNPPFSILSEIINFYVDENIRFFLFVPGLMLRNFPAGCTYIACNIKVEYENGAIVSTSFLTNMDDPDIIARSAPDLFEALNGAIKAIRKSKTKTVRKLIYPPELITAYTLGRFSQAGIPFSISRGESVLINKIDADSGSIYGKGLLVSERLAAERLAAERLAEERLAAERLAAERLAAERLAAERLAAERFELSDAEREIVKNLGRCAK